MSRRLCSDCMIPGSACDCDQRSPVDIPEAAPISPGGTSVATGIRGSRVAELLREDADLYQLKASDYAPNAADPYENFRYAARIHNDLTTGEPIESASVCLALIGVKLSRLYTLSCRKGPARNEPISDTLRDLRIYLAIYQAMRESA